MIRKEYLDVFIIVQHLVWITAVALVVRKFEYFARLAWKCLFLAQKWGFGALYPHNKVQYKHDPQKDILAQKHVIWHVDRQNHLNGCWDIVIYQFFQDGGRPPAWICGAHFGMNRKAYFIGGLYHCAKFGLNHCSGFDSTEVWIFYAFGVKRPIPP